MGRNRRVRRRKGGGREEEGLCKLLLHYALSWGLTISNWDFFGFYLDRFLLTSLLSSRHLEKRPTQRQASGQR